MKNVFGIIMIFVILCFSGCATTSDGKNYSEMAKEKDFNYFFPYISDIRNFATIDEAYDFIKTAQIKFSSATGKSKAKGEAAKLNGPLVTQPLVTHEQPVVMGYFMQASTASEHIDLSKIDKPLETVLRESVMAAAVFMVFYEDRGIVIPDLYLQNQYRFNTGQYRYESLSFNYERYNVDYPPGWNTEKAFSYLKKEIN